VVAIGYFPFTYRHAAGKVKPLRRHQPVNFQQRKHGHGFAFDG
jgi:hypothetical protein